MIASPHVPVLEASSTIYNWIYISIGILTLIGLLVAAKRWSVRQIEKLLNEGIKSNKKLKKQKKEQRKQAQAIAVQGEMLALILHEVGENGGKSLKDKAIKTAELVAELHRQHTTGEPHDHASPNLVHQ